jgi:hypothetical protein
MRPFLHDLANFTLSIAAVLCVFLALGLLVHLLGGG